jgi:leucyl aminopeptidase (aminopeptidase T)
VLERRAWRAEPSTDGVTAIDKAELDLREALREASVVLAPTELSATAPLKHLGRELGFRGATLPDFRREMVPTLALDWEAVDARVREVAARLDRATAARLTFATPHGDYRLRLDLRGGPAHVSGGLIRERGLVANLPSGETFRVPYEGERPGDPSGSAGVLPVEQEGEIVLYRVAGNRAVEVISPGARSRAEAAALAAESAYGNLAELGIGVLSEWGIRAIGSVLLDEKLGLHIAFGRSDHFGGSVGPRDFRDPARVVHIDHVYVPECQPNVLARELKLELEDGSSDLLIRDGRLVPSPLPQPPGPLPC